MVGSGDETEVYFISDHTKTIKLATNRTATIGREKYNDIILNNLLVSRQHALIQWEEQHVIIKDLKSQNGTYVNNNRIDKVELNHGDIIKIGGFEILVQIASQGKIEEFLITEKMKTASKKTMKHDFKGMNVDADGFSGSLTSLSLAEIVQIINQSLKSGLLTVFREKPGAGKAEIYFQEGDIVHAQHKESAGLEAVYSILRSTKGTFEFKKRISATEKTIHESTMKILLESHRLKDEEER